MPLLGGSTAMPLLFALAVVDTTIIIWFNLALAVPIHVRLAPLQLFA
jgi:hypothetical protein